MASTEVADVGGSTARVRLELGRWERPALRPGMVARAPLVEQLAASQEQYVAVLAPAGYGKSTTVRLWDEDDPRPFVWLQLGHLDDDPTHLLNHLARALATQLSIDPRPIDALRGAPRSVDLDLLPAIGTALGSTGSMVVVLDDVHLVSSTSTQRCVESVAAYLPAGSTVALVGRTLAVGALSRRRMDGSLLELTDHDLAMGFDEATALFDAAGLALDPMTLRALVERTEGWPGGLHLAALVLARPGGTDPAGLLSGRDRLVADYLLSEALAGYTTEGIDFLLRSSVLDRMSPALLDQLLDTDVSGRQLLEIEESGNLFLVPLDHDRQWYRYHQLFREALRSRLQLLDPAGAIELERRASRLMEEAGDLDGAIRHAIAAGDKSRAARLIASQSYRLVNNGRVEQLHAWLELLGAESLDRDPDVAIAWAWYAAAQGEHELIQRAIVSAERLGTRRSGVGGGADPAVVAAALIRSLIGLDGLDGLIRHTETVRQAGGPEVNPLWMSATGIQGSALWMLGDLDAAEARLLEARHHIGAEPMFEAGLLAHLAAIRLLRDDLDGARALSKASLELAETYRLDGVLIDVEVFGVGALVAARSRDQTTARRCWLATERLLARLHELSPRTALFCNLLLAETALALGDAAAAAEFADAAASAQRREPSATTLNDWLDDLRQRLQSWPAGPPAGVPRFTPAELRLLEYLPTHLTLQEIADRLNVSRHTTKSHSIAVYRKLGVASRSDAVTEARRIGLLHA